MSVLTLDHIDNNGRYERKILKRCGCSFYSFVKKFGLKQKLRLQVLCYNCNIAKHKNGGVLPANRKDLRRRVTTATQKLQQVVVVPCRFSYENPTKLAV